MGTATGDEKDNDENANQSKTLLKCNLNERMNNFIEALFCFWASKKPSLSAETFYQKMTIFGLVPDTRFIE